VSHARNWILLLGLHAAWVGQMSAQPSPILSSDTLATVGPIVVSERELVERLELMPWQGKERRDHHDSMKVKAILSIIAEHLLAARATELGLGADSAYRLRVENLERMLVRDELYLREVRGKVEVTEAEIAQALRRFSRAIYTVMFLAKTQEDARSLQKKLGGSARLDSVVLASVARYVAYSDTLLVKMGSVEGPVEDAAYALSEARRVSPPVKTGRAGWAVFYFVGAGTNPDAVNLSMPDRRTRAISLLRSRKERERLDAFSGSILGSKRAEVRPELFDAFADNARSIILQDSSRYLRKGGYLLAGEVLDSLRLRMADRLKHTFVEIAEGDITLGTIVEGFRNEEFIFPSLNKPEFSLRLSGAIKRLVEEEFMVREGLRRNLDESENVRHDLGVWDRYWLARVFEQKIRDSVRVSDGEVMKYLIAHAPQVAGTWEVNIREVLLDSLVTALRVLERIQQGEAIEGIARRESRRSVWAEHGGESGYFRLADHPVLGIHALEAPAGVPVGPLQVPEGYSIFTVLGKRTDPKDTLTFSIDSLKNIVRRAITAGKLQAEVNRHIASLAREVPIDIRRQRLSKVTIIPSNMVTRRYLGFGGVMLATPILLPQWEWVRDLPDRKDLLP
jgi:hypothetical protein